MWARLDDSLLDHQKIYLAGRAFGRNGRAAALGFYCASLLYSSKHLTDGYLPKAVVEGMGFADQPLKAAETMVKVGLWEAVRGGFRVHDFHDFNPLAADVQEKRRKDRDRKKRGGNHRHGNGARRDS